MYVFRYETVDDDAASLEAWYEFRKNVYVGYGFIGLDDIGDDGHFRDAFDPYSEHVLIFDDSCSEAPIGTCRIIDGRRTQLQVREQFGVAHGPDALEVSGFALLPAYRKTFASLGCYWLVYERSRSGGYTEVHFEVEEPLLRRLGELGLPIVATGHPRYVFNSWNTPVRVLPSETVPALKEADARRGHATRFGALFEQPWEGVLHTAHLLAGQGLPGVAR